jgi:hypothetical protein
MFFAVISSASMRPIPAEVRVLSVLAKRAAVDFWISFPINGIFKKSVSIFFFPFSDVE